MHLVGWSDNHGFFFSFFENRPNTTHMLFWFKKVKGRGKGQISGMKRLILEARLYRVQQKTNNTDYQSMVFVCVSNNRVAVANQLLIQIYK